MSTDQHETDQRAALRPDKLKNSLTFKIIYASNFKIKNLVKKS
jgi:hypothetical protein